MLVKEVPGDLKRLFIDILVSVILNMVLIFYEFTKPGQSNTKYPTPAITPCVKTSKLHIAGPLWEESTDDQGIYITKGQ